MCTCAHMHWLGMGLGPRTWPTQWLIVKLGRIDSASVYSCRSNLWRVSNVIKVQFRRAFMYWLFIKKSNLKVTYMTHVGLTTNQSHKSITYCIMKAVCDTDRYVSFIKPYCLSQSRIANLEELATPHSPFYLDCWCVSCQIYGRRR